MLTAHLHHYDYDPGSHDTEIRRGELLLTVQAHDPMRAISAIVWGFPPALVKLPEAQMFAYMAFTWDRCRAEILIATGGRVADARHTLQCVLQGKGRTPPMWAPWLPDWEPWSPPSEPGELGAWMVPSLPGAWVPGGVFLQPTIPHLVLQSTDLGETLIPLTGDEGWECEVAPVRMAPGVNRALQHIPEHGRAPTDVATPGSAVCMIPHTVGGPVDEGER